MKKRLLTILSFFSLYAFSQETQDFAIPNYAAKTPEAAAFLKYGEYPVNLSTGVPNISIPLHTIEIPGYSLPIKLDYHASGIKVNQEASWVGLGWNLNFGATIVLNVKGDVDENNSRIDQLPDLDEINDYYEDHPYQVDGGLIGNQELDKPRIKDTYYFSSPTASGEFYIKDIATNDIVVYPPDAFKVEAINGINDVPSGNRSRFKITDATGNVYIFRTSEISKHQNYGQMYNQGEYKSIWYVDEIRTPTNNSIYFSYEDDGITDELTTSQKVDIQNVGIYCSCGSAAGEEHYDQITPIQTMGNHTYTYVKRIKEISFNNGNSKIIFNRINGREDFKSGYNSNLARNYCTSYLRFVEIRQKNTLTNDFQLVRGFDLGYSYFNGEAPTNDYNMKRLKLVSVSDMLTGEGHNFLYSDITLPGKDSYSKDFYGYYNGENNSNLISHQTVIEPYITTVGNADRKVSEYHAKAGVLKEIHYPTQGYTKFNYESNRTYGSTSQTVHRNLSVGTGTYHPDFNMEPNPYEGDLFFEESFIVYSETTGALNWEARNNAGSDYHQILFNPDQFVRLKITRHNTDGSYTTVYDSGLQNGGVASSDFEEAIESYTGSLSLLPGDYSMYIQCHAQNVRMSAVLSFTDMETSTGGRLTGGLRIASIENYDHDDTLLTKKIYSYTMPEDSDKSSGRLVNPNTLNFVSDLTKMFTGVNCQQPGNDDLQAALNYTISRSITSTSQSGEEGNSVTYEYVTEKNINVMDQSSNGYTLYKFSMGYDIFIDEALTFSTPWLRGKLLEKKDFKQVGSINLMLRKEVNTYTDDNSNVSNYKGFMMKRFTTIQGVEETTNDPLEIPAHLSLSQCGGIPSYALGMVQFFPIDLNIPWNYLKSTEVTEYFYDASNTLTSSLVTTKTFTYNNPVHLQLSKEVTTTSTGETLENRYYYPGDNMVQSEPYMADLLQRNVLTPVKKETYVNGEKIQEQKTVFASWPTYDTNSNTILPQTIMGAKDGETLENRVVFVQRDLAGNPVEVKLENGVSVCYIWAYNDSQVVAKIENAKYSSLSQSIIQNIKNASVSQTEDYLKGLLSNLRSSLPNAMVTTYTYTPLIGLHTVTDPKNYTYTYEMDHQGRLRFVKDAGGNIVTENQYHYKN